MNLIIYTNKNMQFPFIPPLCVLPETSSMPSVENKDILNDGWPRLTDRKTRSQHKQMYESINTGFAFASEMYNRALPSLTFILCAIVVSDL